MYTFFVCKNTSRWGLCKLNFKSKVDIVLKPTFDFCEMVGNTFIFRRKGGCAIFNSVSKKTVCCGFVGGNGNGIVVFQLKGIAHYIDQDGGYGVWDSKKLASLLCHREDDCYWYFKKIFIKGLVSPERNFTYRKNGSYKFPLNRDRETMCGEGFNVATEMYIKDYSRGKNNFILEVKIPKDAEVVVPYDLEKVRSDKGILTDSILGGPLYRYGTKYTWWKHLKHRIFAII